MTRATASVYDVNTLRHVSVNEILCRVIQLYFNQDQSEMFVNRRVGAHCRHCTVDEAHRNIVYCGIRVIK